MALYMNGEQWTSLRRAANSPIEIEKKVLEKHLDRTRRVLSRARSGKPIYKVGTPVIDVETDCLYRLDRDDYDELIAHLHPSVSGEPHIIIHRIGSSLKVDSVGDYQANYVDLAQYPNELMLILEATLYPELLVATRSI